MADNYLEKKMEQYRGGSAATAKPKGSLASLVLKNRSTRGYDSTFKVRKDQLYRIVAVNTKLASKRRERCCRISLWGLAWRSFHCPCPDVNRMPLS